MANQPISTLSSLALSPQSQQTTILRPTNVTRGAQAIANMNPPVAIQVPQQTHTFSDPATIASVNLFQVPTQSFTISVANNTTSNQTCYLFNRDVLNTNTTSGVVYTYPNGGSDLLVSSVARYSRAGVGMVLYGAVINCSTTGGTANSAGILLTNPQFVDYSIYNNPIYTVLNLDNQSRADNSDQLFVLNFDKNISTLCQLQFVVPSENVVSLTFYATPNFKL